MPDLLTVDETAEQLTVGPHVVRDLIDQGELEEVRISERHLRVPADSVTDFLARKRRRRTLPTIGPDEAA